MRVIKDKRYESYLNDQVVKKGIEKNIYQSLEFNNHRICFIGHWKADLKDSEWFMLKYKKNTISVRLYDNEVSEDDFIQACLQHTNMMFEKSKVKPEKETSKVKQINAFKVNEFDFHIRKKEYYKLSIIKTDEFYIVFTLHYLFDKDILIEIDNIIGSLTTFEDVRKYKKSFEDLNTEEYVSTIVYGLPTKKKNLALNIQIFIFLVLSAPFFLFLLDTEARKSFQTRGLQVLMFNNEGVWMVLDVFWVIVLVYGILEIITRRVVTPLSIKKLNKRLEAEGRTKINISRRINTQLFLSAVSVILLMLSYTTYSYVSADGVYKNGFWQLTTRKIINYEDVKQFNVMSEYNVSQRKYMMHIEIIDKNNTERSFNEVLFDIKGEQELARGFAMDKLKAVNEVKTLINKQAPNAVINFNIDSSFIENEKDIKENLLDNEPEVKEIFNELFLNNKAKEV